MKYEQKNVDFPLWREKVDKSLFTEGIPLPNWVADMWSIPQEFSKKLRKRDPGGIVDIEFGGGCIRVTLP